MDDLPEANISRYSYYQPFALFLHILLLPRYFHTTTKFIDQAVSSGGLVVVNCVIGWSRWLVAVLARVTLPVLARSATCVAAYLMMKHSMSATKVIESIVGKV